MRLSKFALVFMSLMLGLSACGGTSTPEPTKAATEASAKDDAAKPTEDEKSDEKADEKADETKKESADAAGAASIGIREPKWLIPQNATESEGAEVLNALFSPLVSIDEKNLPVWGDKAPNAVAAEITNNEDNTLWTVKLKDGWTFHNGEPVDAAAYLRAWNWAANPDNAAEASYFFENIEGFKEVQDGKAKEMSGVKAVDEKTIEIKMANAFAPMAGALGYTAFYPLPKVFEEDTKAFNEAPIGNGPFQMEGKWEHNVGIHMTAFDKFGGANKPQVAELEYRIYTDTNTEYNDLLAGSLDVVRSVPNEKLATYEDELDGRVYKGVSSTFSYIGIPENAGKLSESKELRQALSLAIDRETITKTIFSGALNPADDFVSPVVAGYRKGACEFCKYDPAKAKELWDKAGGLKGKLNVWFNAGAGHEEWVEAVSNGWTTTLGLEKVEFKSMQFAEYLKKLEAKEADGPYRLGWSMDYPSSQNYLSIWTTTSTSNYSFYKNEAFDKLLTEGNAAGTLDESLAKYNAADDLILEDLPGIPMYFGAINAGFSENVKNLKIDQFSHIEIVDLQPAS